MHFAVIVVGPDPEAQMAPFRSYFLTGIEDEFVVEIDTTEETRRSYASESTPMLRGPDGELHTEHDPRFYRDATRAELEVIGSSGYGPCMGTTSGLRFKVEAGETGPHVQVLWRPPGFEKVMIPVSERMAFREWAFPNAQLHPGEARTEAHQLGFAELDSAGEVVRCVLRTNPNGEWNYYSLGGRFRGFFPLRARTRNEEDHLGSPGELETVLADWNDEELRDPDLDGESADQTTIARIDFDRARMDSEEEARRRFSSWMTIVSEFGRPKPWTWFVEQEKVSLAKLGPQGFAEEEIETPGRAAWPTRGLLLRLQTKADYAAQPAILHAKEHQIRQHYPVSH